MTIVNLSPERKHIIEKAVRNDAILKKLFLGQVSNDYYHGETYPHMSKAYGRLYITESVSRPNFEALRWARNEVYKSD